MEYKFLSQLHCVRPFLIQNAFSNAEQFLTSYTLNTLNCDEHQRFLQFIYSYPISQSFSLTLNFDIDNTTDYTDCFEYLFSILAHPLYLRDNGSHIIHILNSPVIENQEYLRTLKKRLTAQGFTDFLFIEQNQQENPAFVSLHQIPPGDFFEWYLKTVLQADSLVHIFLHGDDSKHLAKQVTKLRNEAEEKLQKNSPFLYNKIQQVGEKNAEIAAYKFKTRALSAELHSKESYLEYMLGKYNNDDTLNLNEIMKLKRFYFHEYETLPLWYKRFGHIIKVIMGKRTFRSLFNDNVKKYKE